MPNDRIYLVDWSKLATWLVPGILRQPKLLALVQALVVVLNDTHTRFLSFRDATNYRLGITPQVCYLQKALNDKYDNSRRITIVDGTVYLPLPLYQKAENKPQTLHAKSEAIPVVLYTKGETAAFTVDFVVRVPMDLVFDLNEMTAVITNYKLPSKTFKIIRF